MDRVIAISDIHGELDKLTRLLKAADYKPDKDQLILLGDYIDRGPQSRQVLDMVIGLQRQGAFLLKGNHEDLMIQALTTKEEQPWNRWVVRNGGDKTLLSYGLFERDFQSKGTGESFRMPVMYAPELWKHLEFVQSLDHYIETDDFIFVHGGVDPEQELAQTPPYTLMWIRTPFHNGYAGKKKVVFGHTPTSGLHGDAANNHVYYGENNIIGIDGGAVFGGQLNALDVTNGIVYYVR
ncbi:metallophosphoesterase family protein [Paenibacillus physcomitrellae]|uniref:Serine/threonine protein phosphatase n=1 Tax=Paenibacillus physcomitrellae TaxID=1619311 RepID=A0ABQ1GYS8_9BACL|nr:metallophosphoesterase family protein [Paenibacillus physcomitrellae]GGA52646.1 serine/threonine protein phosphatase [Paenibacillus physcomitrellae]